MEEYWNTSTECWTNSFKDIINSTYDVDQNVNEIYLYIAKLIFILLRCVFACLAVGGNLLTICVVFKYANLWTTTNLLVVSLAVCDMANGLFLWPVAFAELLTKQTSQRVIVCKVRNFLISITAFENVAHVCSISVERFIFLHYPLHYPNVLTMNRMRIWLCTLWLAGLLFGLVLSPTAHDVEPGTLCDFRGQTRKDIYKFIVLPHYAIFSAVTVLLYIKIAILSWKYARKIAASASTSDNSASGYISKHQLKITKMLGLVLGIYFILYIPTLVTRTSNEKLVQLSTALTYYIIVLVYYINSWVNVFIYGLNSREFRQAYKRIMGIRPDSDIGNSASHLTNSRVVAD